MAKKPQSSRPGRLFFYGSFGLLALSGIAWAVARYLLEGREGWGWLVMGAQAWALKAHGAGIMLFLLALGRAYAGFKAAFLAVFGLLIFSGWLVYYGPSGDWYRLVSITHQVWGLVACAALCAAVMGGKKARGVRRRR